MFFFDDEPVTSDAEQEAAVEAVEEAAAEEKDSNEAGDLAEAN